MYRSREVLVYMVAQTHPALALLLGMTVAGVDSYIYPMMLTGRTPPLMEHWNMTQLERWAVTVTHWCDIVDAVLLLTTSL